MQSALSLVLMMGVLQYCSTDLAEKSLNFTIWEQKEQELSNKTGVLLTVLNSTSPFLVCRDNKTPSLTTAKAICQYGTSGRGFHHAVWTNLGDANGQTITLQCSISVGVKTEIKCESSQSSASKEHVDVTDSSSDQNCEAVLNCTCDEGYAWRPDGCKRCPPHSSNDGTARRCSCDEGYYHSHTHNPEWVCKKCKEDTYGGGGVNSTCTSCPEGERTGGWEGKTNVSGCKPCNGDYKMWSFGKCINMFYLAIFVSAAAIVAGFLLFFGVRLYYEGLSISDKSKCTAKCRNESRVSATLLDD